MFRITRLNCWVVGVGLLFPVVGAAQERVVLMPVFSIDAVAVNDVSIPAGPASKVSVAPGDVITAKFHIRNWSPDGQMMRAFQITMDAESFKSGTAGAVQPFGYSPGTPNDANAFIDLNDPDFVHKGLPSIPLTDSTSERYRWLNVLINSEESPVSAQDGKKYYCATLKLQASPDASGTFTIGMIEESRTSGLLDPENIEIFPIGYEPLVVEVRGDVHWLRIESSDPPNGAIDARLIPIEAGQADASWKSVKLGFSGDVSTLTADDFVIEDGSSAPPKITGVKASGSELTLLLDRGIRAASWTTIQHKASGSLTRVGRLPGDVNNDGRADGDDLLVLLRVLNGAEALPDYRRDLDGDGKADARDALRYIEQLTAADASRSRLPK